MVGSGLRPMPPRDLEYVRRIASGDASAYLLIQPDVHRAFAQVWARLRHRYPNLEADRTDLMQAFELHLVGDDYHVLTTFRGEARLSTWLHAVAMRHVSRNAQRLVRHRAREGGELDPNRADGGTDPEVRAVRISERDRVRRALGGLSDMERNLVAMFFEQGLDASQVARTLGIGAAGVRMRKKRLLAKLQKTLEGVD